MRVTEKATVETNKTIDIVCDKCGLSLITSKSHGHTYYSEFVYMNEIFGYSSNIFGDMGGVEADICEKCLWDFVQTFKNKDSVIK